MIEVALYFTFGLFSVAVYQFYRLLYQLLKEVI